MEVQLSRQSITDIFNGTIFYKDFYQRQYNWSRVEVSKLLDDIFYQFDTEYSHFQKEKRELKDVIECGGYSMNMVIICKDGNKAYVVDGLQRLTTLYLILMKLQEMSLWRGHDIATLLDSMVSGVIEEKEYYWMSYEEQMETLVDIYDNGITAKPHDSSETAQTLVRNYKVIDARLEEELLANDSLRFEAFVSYFLNRIAFVQLDIQQADIPMVFKVINERVIL